MMLRVFYLLLFWTPPSTGDVVSQAVQLYGHGEYQDASQLLSAEVKQSPEDAKLWLWLGKSMMKARKWDGAVQALERAVTLKPDDGVYRLWLARAYGQKASHASFFTAFGWARKVARTYQKAQELAPENLDIKFDLLEFYLDAPGIVGGGKDKAEDEAEAIARISPVKGCTARSEIYQDEKKWKEAQEELVKATVLAPKEADGYVDLADFLLRRGDFQQAAADARKALSINPRIPRARLILAAAQVRLGKDLSEPARALADLSKGPLTYDDPPFEEVFYWLGQARLAEGDKAEAREAFQTALHYNPDYEKAKEGLAQTD